MTAYAFVSLGAFFHKTYYYGLSFLSVWDLKCFSFSIPGTEVNYTVRWVAAHAARAIAEFVWQVARGMARAALKVGGRLHVQRVG